MNEQTLVTQSGEIYRKGEKVWQKKAKAFFAVEGHPELLIMRCLDVAASDDGQVEEQIPGKGKLNATISSILFELLHGRYADQHQSAPIKTHFVSASQNDPAECLVRRMAQVVPLEVIVRNRAYGSFVRDYGADYGVVEGERFAQPICAFTLKNDARRDPLIPNDHILALGIATQLEIDHMREVALAVNRVLIEFFQAINIDLADFKLVFGRQSDVVGDYTNLRIIGEISPDTCRLRDIKTGKCLDKDIFRQGLSGLTEAYAVVSQKMLDQRDKDRKKGNKGDDAYDEFGNPLK